ncbi:MAG: hypothetical protein AAGC93_07500 [Cyanobacteria bacterium P01_F01_bin.53]
MKHSHDWPHNWAVTATLTVCASLVLAMYDAAYRPAFVQIAMVAVVAAKEHAANNDASEEDRYLPADEDNDMPTTQSYFS